mgnify:FL=1
MKSSTIALAAVAFSAAASVTHAGAQMHHTNPQDHAGSAARAWTVHTMAQVFPILTASAPFDDGSRLNDREAYLTQPVLMLGAVSPRGRVAFDLTLDFEQFTQPDGEYTFGGWGEGFIDRRHPHTLLHELMVSVTPWTGSAGTLSLSAGKGFAPYGTEDPMSRPVVKYPTNHHLSQVLERWTVNATLLHPAGWSLELGLFGGAEPTDAYDLSNIESFGDSWSGRLTKAFGGHGLPSWELSGSYARIEESHGAETEVVELANTALRYEALRPSGRLYGLLEASKSFPEDESGYWAVLAEGQLRTGLHQPYARVEWSTRPEYHRLGAPGTPEFYRYDHDTHTDGATRWVIATLGYGRESATAGVSYRPFAEVQYHRVSSERGGVDPMALFGQRAFWSVSTGFRLFWGGGPMRMGRYGALAAHAPTAPVSAGSASHAHHTP